MPGRVEYMPRVDPAYAQQFVKENDVFVVDEPNYRTYGFEIPEVLRFSGFFGFILSKEFD